MAAGQNKVILEVLVKAKAETAAMGKAKGAMKGLGNATKKAGKDMHHFRIITADTQRRIGALRNVLLLIKFAMATMGIRMLTRQMGSWVKAWALQEKAVNRLNVALAGVGRYTKQVSENYQKMAADMQKASVFGDEAILEVMQTLMTLGNVADKDMRRATQAVLDFSAATGRDLAMATLLVAKAAVGYTGELSRYGIMIDKSLSKTEKFAATLEFLAKMKGRAEAETWTLEGAVKQLGNSYGDAKEKIGKVIAEQTNLLVTIKLVNEFVITLANNTGLLANITFDLSVAFLSTMDVMYRMRTGLVGFTRGFILLGKAISYVGLANQILKGDFISSSSRKRLVGTLKELNKELGEQYNKLIDTGKKYNDFKAFLDKFAKKIPEYIKQTKAWTDALKSLNIEMGAMSAVKAWDVASKSAEKYYKKTYSEEQKKKRQEIDAIKTTLNAKLNAIYQEHEKHLDKIEDLKEFSKKAQEYNKIEAQMEKESAEKIARMENQFAKDKEANWIKEMRSIKKLGKLTRSEEIANRKALIDTWAVRQWEMTGTITAEMSEEEVREIMKNRKELIDKLKKMRAEIPLYLPETPMQAVESGLAKLVDSYGNTYDRIANLTQDLASTMQSTMSDVLYDAFTGELKTTEEYYQAFAKTMLKTTMDYVSQQIMATLVGENIRNLIKGQSEAKMTAMVAGGEAARTTAVVTGEAKQAVAVTAASSTKVAANTAEGISAWQAAIAEIIKAHSWIPYVGMAIAGAAIGYAVGMAGKNKKLFAKGGIVTSRTDATIGEAGPEAVIPLKRGAGGKLGIASYGGGEGGGGTVVENHYYINAVDPRSFADIVESNPAIISEVINRNIKRNGTNRDVMRTYT